VSTRVDDLATRVDACPGNGIFRPTPYYRANGVSANARVRRRSNSDKSFRETQLRRDQMTAIMPARRRGVRARAGHTGWLTGNWRHSPM